MNNGGNGDDGKMGEARLMWMDLKCLHSVPLSKMSRHFRTWRHGKRDVTTTSQQDSKFIVSKFIVAQNRFLWLFEMNSRVPLHLLRESRRGRFLSSISISFS